MSHPVTLLALDPGKLYAGWTFYVYGKLVRAGMAVVPANRDLPDSWKGNHPGFIIGQRIRQHIEHNEHYMRFGLSEFVGETMKHRGRNELQPKAFNEKILPLIGTVHMVAGICCTPTTKVIVAEPDQWKGSLDGDIWLRRILSKSTKEERSLINNLIETKQVISSEIHNVIDAHGLALWRLGRISPTRSSSFKE